MICPNCKYEYNLGVTKCPDCGADLVYRLPSETTRKDLPFEPVVVLETMDYTAISLAKSILTDAGIEYFTQRGIGVRSLKFFVAADEAAQARELLKGLA